MAQTWTFLTSSQVTPLLEHMLTACWTDFALEMGGEPLEDFKERERQDVTKTMGDKGRSRETSGG